MIIKIDVLFTYFMDDNEINNIRRLFFVFKKSYYIYKIDFV